MAKYCELAGKVTNCTENCKFCLEEETKPVKSRLETRSGISPKITCRQKNWGTIHRKEPLGSSLELKTALFHILSDGRKEQPKTTDVGMLAEKTSSLFKV